MATSGDCNLAIDKADVVHEISEPRWRLAHS